MLVFRRASVEGIPDLNKFLEKDKHRFQIYYRTPMEHDVKRNNFKKEGILGVGAFGRVFLVKETSSEDYYALKQIRKKRIVEQEQVQHAWCEKRVLQSVNFPFLVYLKYYFYDNTYLYFVMPFVKGGEFFNLLKERKSFEEVHSQFYAAQILLALEYLHYMDLIYRDLKPENVLIDDTGYIRISDFGFCKRIDNRTYTLCGTPEYIAPEVIMNKGYGKSADWWSFGILIYEMNNGSPPFQHWDPIELYDKICSGDYNVPLSFSNNLKDLLNSLIQTDLTKRLGTLKGGVNDLKKHKWFKQIVWPELLNRKTPPPFKPALITPGNEPSLSTSSDDLESIDETDEFSTVFSNF